MSIDHSSHREFLEYYATESQSQKTRDRFSALRDIVLRVVKNRLGHVPALEVLDVGCGAGALSLLWADAGHRVHGLDVNEPLLKLAKERAEREGKSIEFKLGSATNLPWSDQSMDVCMVPELLEHVAEWQVCLAECVRILRPGGVLLLTTSNKLCPVQQEFNLPLYSWYPGPIKRYFEQLALTTRPELANFAKYPAVNWFSFYSLRSHLANYGLHCLDRFDVIDAQSKSSMARLILVALRKVALLRFLGHVATPSTIVVGIKQQIG
jgi:2-polyprenyl-3-methyl-5-hydroxy-6-metoxy-1,4-benzoquinol methylase